MRTDTRLAALLMTAVLMLTGCSSGTAERPELLEAVNANVDIAIAEVMDLSNMTFNSATVIPDVEEIGFDRAGYLYGIYVEPGDRVGEGEVLASLVGPNFKAISNLEDEIEELEEENEENFTYLEAELELEALSGADTEELELKLKHERELAELKLEEKRARLEELKEDDFGYIYITAPRDCIVVAVTTTRTNGYVAEGAPVCAIEGTGEPMVTCDFISEKKINALEDYYCLIDGQRYEIEYVPYTKEELKVLATNGVTTVSRFRFTSDITGIAAGDYAAVITVAGVADGVLAIPVNSVYSDSEGDYVYKVVDNVRIKQSVECGITNAAYVEIVSGLEEGDGVYVKN